MVVGALVIMAASSVAAGFVIGRMTAGPTAASVSTRVEGVASGDNSTTTAVASSVPFKKQPERDTPMTSGGGSQPFVILNPGTADIGYQDKPDSAPSTRFRDASALRSDLRNVDPRDNRRPAMTSRVSGSDGLEQGSSTERDYRALRDYMLSR